MADIIQLLPDAIANQIAAGEVIQRPASVVKELMENAIDAGSSSVKLIIKDAGKTLIQVIDNGCGMTETDARMSFERHATSKIRSAQDLFSIRSMGFRGEALASIAAVAQVEVRTRRQADELGVRLVVEGSQLKTQEACQCASGTNLSVKNLFFNVPARRNFLKSNTVEMRHILDEFQRLAMAHPDIFFSLHHNNSEVFHLPAMTNLRQRAIGVLGQNTNKKLVPVTEETDVLKISGFVGKPEFAKKTRGEQFFFVNNRFIKSAYLNHAIMNAYEELLPKDTFPLFVIFIEIDPSKIDINVHPTKQEIKFDDERLVYNYLKVAVRHSLGQYSIMPTLDFEQEPSFTPGLRQPTAQHIQTFPSAGNGDTSSKANHGSKKIDQRQENNLKNWEKIYEGLDEAIETETDTALTIESEWTEGQAVDVRSPYQVHSTYIVSHIKSGFLLIDQQSAHERILYEHFLDLLNKQTASTQQQLFPKTITVSPTDATILNEILPQINLLGFDVQDFGNDTFIINGIPAEFTKKGDEAKVIETLLEQYKQNIEFKLEVKENIARSLARSGAIKRGQNLDVQEMQSLIDKLFACEVPFKSPSGRQCFLTFELEELSKRFEH